MNLIQKWSCVFICLIIHADVAFGSLSVSVERPKMTGSQTNVRMTIRNSFSNAVESARAAVFIEDENGKVVGQATRWVIGGAKDHPALGPDKKILFNFVVPVGNRISTKLTCRVLFNRVTLVGGASVDLNKVEVVQASGP